MANYTNPLWQILAFGDLVQTKVCSNMVYVELIAAKMARIVNSTYESDHNTPISGTGQPKACLQERLSPSAALHGNPLS